MKKFFGDIQEFRKALEQKEDVDDYCWSCSVGDGPLVWFNAHKDLHTLGQPAPGRNRCILLCPGCAVDYMNSFNVSLGGEQGCQGPQFLWTVESYLSFGPGRR